MRIFAIDPGTRESAYVLYDKTSRRVLEYGKRENSEVLSIVGAKVSVDTLAVEMIASYGMPVGAEVFETVLWIGRFVERYQDRALSPVVRKVYRREVKMHLCASPKANDPAIRQRLMDLFGGSGAIGLKKTPGPLYGLKADMWSALAVAITAAETTPDAANLVRRAA